MRDIHDLQRLDLNLLPVFDALLREGNLTRAGASLGMSQSGASHALKRLREYFDDPLFVKAGHGIVPTPKGRELGQIVSSLIDRVRQDVLPAAHFDPSTERRAFTFCLSDMGELVFVPALLSRLRAEAPLAEIRTIQVAASQLETVLGTGEADLALGALPRPPDELYQQGLMTHSFVCIVHSGHASKRPRLTLEEYTAMSHVVVMLGSGRYAGRHDAAVDEAGISRHVAVSTPHFLLVPWLIEQNPQYIATVPRALGAIFAQYGVVAVKEPPLDLPGIALRQYWHPRFHHDAANHWLRQLVKSAVDALPDSMR